MLPCEDILMTKEMTKRSHTRMFSYSQNTLTVLCKPQLFFIPQIPLSPLKVIYVQIISVTPFVKDLSHLSGEGPTQHDFSSCEQDCSC